MIDVRGLSVFLAMPVHQPVHYQVHVCMVQTMALLQTLGVPHELFYQEGGLHVENRTMLTNTFLQHKQNRMFCFDSDIVWKPQDVIRMLWLSKTRDVVVAAYPKKMDSPDYDINFLEDGTITQDEEGCFEIAGTGLGFAAIQRGIIENLAKQAPPVRLHGRAEVFPGIFRWEFKKHVDGVSDVFGEDIGFFSDIRALGYKVWLDPAIALGHIGTKIYRASLSEHIERLAAP